MRKRKYSQLFKKEIGKLKGKELENVIKKRDEILNNINIDHYKNLTNELKRFKRVHVNNSYVILFYDSDNTVYFIDYAHHDIIYSKKRLRKYSNIRFF